MEIRKFKGLIAAPFTPFDMKGNLNKDLIPEYYNFLERNGIVGAFINGTTGEGPSLTQKEKQINTELWAKCLNSGGKVKIINLVGGTSYKECIENAVLSAELGISAIAVIAPYFFRPCDENILAEFVTEVGMSVPNMPVYYYHIPIFTGVNVSMRSFLEKISRMLPNFAGIKFTHEDFMDYLDCINYKNKKYDILWGRDECLLAALSLGGLGAVGSTYNYAAPLYHKMIDAFNKGDMETARKLQQKSIDLIKLIGKYGGIATGKAFMKYIGLDCGLFRLPVKNMTPKIYDNFKKEVESLEMDKLFSSL